MRKPAAYLAKHPDDKDSTQKETQEGQETLLSEIARAESTTDRGTGGFEEGWDIRYWVRKATPGTQRSKEPPKKRPIKVLQDKADEKKHKEPPGTGETPKRQGYGTCRRHLPFQSENVKVLFISGG